MTELDFFQVLKKRVLLKYQENYPFFKGTWKSFSSKDIQNLIVLIEEKSKATISEKWIYSHLKPEINTKVPRKDMLNILSIFVGYSSWDEFSFNNDFVDEKIATSNNKFIKRYIFVAFILALITLVWYFKFYRTDYIARKTIQLNNEFTNKKVNSDEIKVFKIDDSIKQLVEVKDGKIEVDNLPNNKSKLEIVSPFYKRKMISLNDVEAQDSLISEIALKPDDHAMMLKAFMLSDIKDWQTRRMQLNKILSENLEVIVMLKDDLGAEYFNKNEFSQKLIVPTNSLKKMKIIEIISDEKGIIQFIRIKQE